MLQIRKAERQKAKLKCALIGISGSGKTYSSLLIATGLKGKICVLDTENNSADLYAGKFEYDVAPLLPPYSPQAYVAAIKQIEKAGYDIIIIDSLTHAWAGEGGALDMQANIMKANKMGNSFAAWRDVTPHHNALVNAILQSPTHVIVTMRTKTHYDIIENEKGKKTPVKIGLAPVQRDGLEYEFTLVLDVNEEHYAIASKDRTSLFDRTPFLPKIETGEVLYDWLNTGVDAPMKAIDPPKILTLSEQEKSSLVDKSTAYADRISECNSISELQTIYATAYKELIKYSETEEGKLSLDQISSVKDIKKLQFSIEDK